MGFAIWHEIWSHDPHKAKVGSGEVKADGATQNEKVLLVSQPDGGRLEQNGAVRNA